ncbi:MAG: hypothetical protein QM831_17370 [Kofleriaceae bacterium]
MRALVASVAIHVGLIAIAMRPVVEEPPAEESTLQPMTLIDVSVEAQAVADDDGGGGGAGERVAMKLPAAVTRGETRADVGWEATTLGYESGNSAGDGGGDGTGTGTGHGNGRGAGHGLGRSASELSLHDLPPPPAPHISKARPAKLLHPTREMDVEEDDLFAAMVTVDATGDVVGARMTKTHPGSRGDAASSSIWQFRYSPALDDDGNPVRSTFVQTFAVR